MKLVYIYIYPSVLKILHRYTRLKRAWTRFPSLSDVFRRTCRVTYIAVSNVPTVSFERELFRLEFFSSNIVTRSFEFRFENEDRKYWKMRGIFFFESMKERASNDFGIVLEEFWKNEIFLLIDFSFLCVAGKVSRIVRILEHSIRRREEDLKFKREGNFKRVILFLLLRVELFTYARIAKI